MLSELIRALRKSEKRQTIFYRTLAADAKQVGEEAIVERLNELHADEQHHLSRLTARLLELGVPLDDLSDVEPPSCDLESWETTARQREKAEIAAYEAALEAVEEDPVTHDIFAEILASERQHEKNLAGKWMPA